MIPSRLLASGLLAIQLVVAASTLVAPSGARAASVGISAYMVGNSLSWDAYALGGLVDLFAKGGTTLSLDYHIRCGSSLSRTLANASDPCQVSDDGPWDVALPSNDYDLLILQPHEGALTQSEIGAMDVFSSLSSARPVIYEAYPGYEAAADLAAFYARAEQAWFQQSAAELLKIETVFPTAAIVPAMQVMIAFDAYAKAGEIPGIASAQELYRDSRHLNGVGRYLVGLTFFAALTDLDPAETGLSLHAAYGDVSLEQALAMQGIVADVVLAPVPLPAAALLFPAGMLVVVMLGRARGSRCQTADLAAGAFGGGVLCRR